MISMTTYKQASHQLFSTYYVVRASSSQPLNSEVPPPNVNSMRKRLSISGTSPPPPLPPQRKKRRYARYINSSKYVDFGKSEVTPAIPCRSFAFQQRTHVADTLFYCCSLFSCFFNVRIAFTPLRGTLQTHSYTGLRNR